VSGVTSAQAIALWVRVPAWVRVPVLARVPLCGGVRPRARVRACVQRAAVWSPRTFRARARPRGRASRASASRRGRGAGLCERGGSWPSRRADVLLVRLELHPVALRFQPAQRQLGQPRVRVAPRQRVLVRVAPRQRVLVRRCGAVAPRQRVSVRVQPRQRRQRVSVRRHGAGQPRAARAVVLGRGASRRVHSVARSSAGLEFADGVQRTHGLAPGWRRDVTSGNGSRLRTRRASSFLVRCLVSARTSTRLSEVRWGPSINSPVRWSSPV
jgi:hypothetical protein